MRYFIQGVTDILCEACEKVGWKKPTKIQQECIPLALQGLLVELTEYCGLLKHLISLILLSFNIEKDIIGLAETGSGKTGAFALPILQTLLDNPQRLFALVLTPTRYVHCRQLLPISKHH